MQIKQALQTAATLQLGRLDAQLLLLQALGQPLHERAWLLAHDADVLSDAQQQQFALLCQRRAAGEPQAYIAGVKEFHGLALQVDPRVLIPRPDTETLVDWALALLPENAPTPRRVLDLGTGSGAIALAIAHARPGAHVQACDASESALQVARANALRLSLPVEFCHSDWFSQVDGRFDLLVSNPPYIAQGDAHLAALQHEPQSALTSGADGLQDIRQIIAQAHMHLNPGGWLLLEHGYDQAHAVRALLQQAGFTQAQSRSDLAGIERCSGACWLA